MRHLWLPALASAVFLRPSPAVAQATAACDSLQAEAAKDAQPLRWYSVAPRFTHQIIPPQEAPRDQRLGEIQVVFHIDTLGHPIPYGILVLGTEDTSYVRRLQKQMAGSRFQPAQKDGCRVASSLSYIIRYQKDGMSMRSVD